MKPKLQTLIRVGAVCAAAVLIIIISVNYFSYVSDELFAEASEHLKEVYQQADHSFVFFTEKNWGDLRDWETEIKEDDDASARAYIAQRKEYWGFSQFYFISDNGKYITAEGEIGTFDLGKNADLLKEGTNVMFNAATPMGVNITLFAVPVEKAFWDTFEYSAIAVSYTNADMVEAINVDAFSGESGCFILEPDGEVLLSTLAGGSVFKNYISYLAGASDLSGAEIESLRAAFAAGDSGTIRADIADTQYYIYYQRSGYLDTMLIGVVPADAAGANLLKIQRATADVLIKIALLVSIPIILWIIWSYREKTKKGAMELRYREKMFDVLSNNINDIFLMIDAKKRRVDYLSPNVERLMGIPHGAVEKNPMILGENLTSEGEFMNIDEFDSIPINGKRSYEREHINLRTGEPAWFLETVYREDIDNTEKFLIVMSDRTYERDMNKQLREALDAAESANRSKSRFLSNMSHDIRTPMNAIIGFTGLLAKDAEDPEKVRSYVKKISASSHHLLSLINDVLDMSKIESGNTSLNNGEFTLPEVLDELYTIIHSQAEAKSQTFNIFVNGHPPERLIGDALRLNQILVNLLSNAVKYTPEGGSIDLLVEEIPQNVSQLIKLRFTVSDNGIGMSPEYLETLFEPFTRETTSLTKKTQGTGLGMAITKNLIALMGGTIDVKSATGEGTTFTVELLFAPASPEEDKLFWEENGIKRILIVDDDRQILENIKNILEEAGVNAECAQAGEEALDIAMQLNNDGEDFDAYLLDLKMPGIDGTQTARLLREQIGTHAPIILLTAYDRSEIENEARQAGVDLFLTKPFFLTSFRLALKSFYAAHKITDAADEEALGGMRFLVAEDNDLNAEVLTETLSLEGAEAERAENGKEVVEMFLKSKPGDYDMILMDVQMPEMNGYEATRAIRESNHPSAKTIPIIAMTANAFAEDIQEALNSGMDAHLAKPVYMDTLTAQIHDIKKKRGGAV